MEATYKPLVALIELLTKRLLLNYKFVTTEDDGDPDLN